MEITNTTLEKATVIHVTGRLDALNNEKFELQCTEMIDSLNTNIIVDLSQLQYISSAGLRSILKLVKYCQQKKLSLMLCSLQPSVFDVFKISGFATFLKIFNSIDEAVALSLIHI